MARGGTFASIDIGTTKICTVVGEVTHDDDMRILGVGVAPSLYCAASALVSSEM